MGKLFLALIGIAMLNSSAQAQKIYDFTSVEKPPIYPGGIANFYKYLAGKLKYPELAIKNKTEGKVFLSFIVEKNGKLTDVSITRGLSKETDAEAKRALGKSPNWEPGVINGKTVRVRYNLNVNFNLNNESKDSKASTQQSLCQFSDYPVAKTQMHAFLAQNLKYPIKARREGIAGQVYLSFNVQEDGAITDVEVIKGLTKEINEEAVRVIKSAPKWNIRSGNEKPCIKKYQMAINFSLS